MPNGGFGMRQLTATAGLTFVLVTACIDAAEPPELTLTEELTATLRGDSVLLHNGSTERVHFALNGEEDPNRILWQLCAGPDCPGLETGADDAVPLSALDLRPDAEAAFVHWWHAEPDGTGRFRPDSIRTIRLAL